MKDIEPIWVDQHTIQMFHDFQIDKHGGSHGMRDKTLLLSALGKPKNLYAYGQGDLFDMAASYAYGIAKNHPFIDGNKRTSFVTAALFLQLNGYRLNADKAEAVVMTVSLANGEIDEKIYAQWLRDNCEAE